MRWLALLVLAQNVNVTPIETRQDGVRVPRLDAGDNGKRDYSDAQLRIAVEAELNRSQK